MNKLATSRCTKVVTPVLADGEQIELVEAVQIGKVSAKKRVAVAAVAAVASAGTLMVTVRPRPFFLVLTDKRLILINNMRGIVGKVAATAPRKSITAEPLRGHVLTLSMNVTIDGTAHRFSWGRAQTAMAKRVAAALTSPETSPAPTPTA